MSLRGCNNRMLEQACAVKLRHLRSQPIKTKLVKVVRLHVVKTIDRPRWRAPGLNAGSEEGWCTIPEREE